MTYNPEIATNTAYTYDDVAAAFAFGEVDDDYWCRYFGARYYDPNISIWLSVDPLSDKYPGHTPYNYTLNNPILFVDPDGRSAGDFYNENGTFLGTDGINDGKVYVVTEKSEQKAIKKTHKSGGTTQASSVNSRLELPSAYVRQKMGDAVDRSNAPTSDDTKGGFHEEGGVFGTHNGQEWVAEAKPGPYSDPSKDSYAEINVLNTRSGQSIPSATAEGSYHVHPGGEVRVPAPGNTFGGERIFNFQQTPSGSVGGSTGDIPTAASRSAIITGNSYVLGARSGRVYIYNGKGVLGSFPLEEFRSIGIK